MAKNHLKVANSIDQTDLVHRVEECNNARNRGKHRFPARTPNVGKSG